MQTRQALVEVLGLDSTDLVDLVVNQAGDISTEDLAYLLLQIELEIQYRQDTGAINL